MAFMAALFGPAKATPDACCSVVQSERATFRVSTIAMGLDHPWGLVFLPDGRMLVTERPGRIRLVDHNGRISPPLGGVPFMPAGDGEGGLLDVALAPDFAQTREIY